MAKLERIIRCQRKVDLVVTIQRTSRNDIFNHHKTPHTPLKHDKVTYKLTVTMHT